MMVKKLKRIKGSLFSRVTIFSELQHQQLLAASSIPTYKYSSATYKRQVHYGIVAIPPYHNFVEEWNFSQSNQHDSENHRQQKLGASVC